VYTNTFGSSITNSIAQCAAMPSTTHKYYKLQFPVTTVASDTWLPQCPSRHRPPDDHPHN